MSKANFCYKELLNRVNRFDRDLVYDIGGDWAAGRNNILRTGNTFQKNHCENSGTKRLKIISFVFYEKKHNFVYSLTLF